MSKLFDRRDFLLHVAPLIGASGLILGSVSEMEAQIKNFALRTPIQNAQVNVGQTIQISLAALKIQYPKIRRIDFKANGQMIGTTATRPFQMNWQPTQAGNFTLTAEAVLANGAIVATPSVNITVGASQLEVLYDTLGNATDGWGWAGQGSYTSTFSRTAATNYSVVTCFIGSISTPKRIRTIEIAGGARNSASGTSLTPAYFNSYTWLRIWNRDIQSFWNDPLGGSVYGQPLPNINLGDRVIPIVPQMPGAGGSYVFGWGNLDIPLPANVVLEMSIQYEAIQIGDLGSIAGSSRPGPNMLRSTSSTGNGTIIQPMATRIKVSN